MLPNAVRLFAACAPGKRLVVTASGKDYSLPEIQETPPVKPEVPDAFEQARLALVDAAARIAGTEAVMREALSEVIAGQTGVTESVQQMAEVLAMPFTQPIYNADGKLIGAKRVKNLESA